MPPPWPLLAGRSKARNAPGLNELAETAGLSSFHFHRVFKAVTGLTPRGYAAAHRSRRVRECLTDGGSVTDALYDAGFNSNSRFYEAADQLLGMKPGLSRGRPEQRHSVCRRPMFPGRDPGGAERARGLRHFAGDDPQQLVCDLQDKFRRANLIGADQDFEQLIARVVGFIEAPALGLTCLWTCGTAFQERVWQPCGTFPSAARPATPISPGKSARQKPFARWPKPAARTAWR
jgi:AraC family transcriptional regulator of adaptative response/methylated-DNA-[protein]-cysteine methyltransferase